MTDYPVLVLAGDDLKRFRIGDVRRADTSDGTPVLVVLESSPNRKNITWPIRLALSTAELDLVETDPAGQLVRLAETGALVRVVTE